MTVAFFTEFPQATPEMARQISEYVNTQLGDKPPEGGIYHAEGPTDNGGWWAFDVWESDDTAERFYADILTPTLESVNVPKGQPRKLSVQWESHGS
ncbi:MAG: hypothetical protein M3511_16100 [Deinococcota bacterium]|jgi:hypothetical protein|nr:hypothetical protein [Deinococcota bacterium]